MLDSWTKWQESLSRRLWEKDVESLKRHKGAALKALRLLSVSLREVHQGQLALRATSLVYTSLLSMVPLLAVTFSVLKAFGVHNQIEPVLYSLLEPLGDRGGELTSTIIVFVERTKVGVLGSVGLVTLVLTVISLISKIEDAFNHIWSVKKTRNFARRFSDYLSILLIGPLFMFSAVGVTASIMSTSVIQTLASIEPFGSVIYGVGQLSPYLFTTAAFTLTYFFLPNTRVKFRSALTGGIFAGLLWQVLGWAFAYFVVSSTQYAAIYSSFAILILFIMWLDVSWIILLVGAEISFFHQFPQLLMQKKCGPALSARLKEKLAYTVMYMIGHSFYYNKKPWNLDSLVARLRVPVGVVQETIGMLEEGGFIAQTGDYPPAYLPARDIGTISMLDVLNAIRGCKADEAGVGDKIPGPEIEALMVDIEKAIQLTLEGKQLKSLILAGKIPDL